MRQQLGHLIGSIKIHFYTGALRQRRHNFGGRLASCCRSEHCSNSRRATYLWVSGVNLGATPDCLRGKMSPPTGARFSPAQPCLCGRQIVVAVEATAGRGRRQMADTQIRQPLTRPAVQHQLSWKGSGRDGSGVDRRYIITVERAI